MMNHEREEPPGMPNERFTSPTKRRKTRHVSSSQQEVIDLDDDDVESVEPPGSSKRPDGSSPAIPPSVSSWSQTSNDRRRPNAVPRNVFRETSNKVEIYRQPKSRHKGSPSTPRQNSAQSGSAINVYDSTPKHEEPDYRRVKEDSSEDDLAKQPVVSRHFLPEVKGSVRINSSTSFKNTNEPISRPRADQKSSNLRDQFVRNTSSKSIEDKDQSAPDKFPHTKAGQDSFPSQSTQSMVSRKQNRSGAAGTPQWPLLSVRTYNYERQGSELYLRPSSDQKIKGFKILEKANRGFPDRYIETRKINDSRDDGVSRIRLKGTQDVAGEIYWYELRFVNNADLLSFRDKYLVEKGVVKKPHLTTEEEMIILFSKPLVSNNKNKPPIPPNDEEIELMQKRAGKQQKSLVPRPHSGLLHNLTSKQAVESAPQGSMKSRQQSVTVRQDSTTQAPYPPRTTRSSRINCEHDIKKSVSRDLSPIGIEDVKKKELEIRWSKPVQYGEGRRRALVEFDDLPKLDNGQMLNDALVDFYLIYLFDQARVPEKTVYFFNTHFFTSLTRLNVGQRGGINYENVSRWVKEDIFAYDFIVVPVCENEHWYLAIICNVSEIGRKYAEVHDAHTAAGGTHTAHKYHMDADEISNSNESDVILFEEAKNASNDKQASKTPPESANNQLELADPRGSALRESSIEETGGLQSLSIEDPSVRDSIPVPQVDRPTADGEPGADAKKNEVSVPSSAKKRKKQGSMSLKKYPPNEPIILILDSLANNHPKTCRVLKEYITQEALQKRGMDAQITQKPFYVKEMHIPLQENVVDCGVYLLGYWQKFVFNPRDFVNRILSREMDPDTDWPNMTATNIRNDMRKTLCELAASQEEARKAAKAAKKTQQAATLSKGAKGSTEYPKPKSSHLIQETGVRKEHCASSVKSPEEPRRTSSPQVIVRTRSSPQPPPRQPIARIDLEQDIVDISEEPALPSKRVYGTEEPRDSFTINRLPSPASSRVATSAVLHRGSSQDPINIEDSQETVGNGQSPRQKSRPGIRPQPSIEEVPPSVFRSHRRTRSLKGPDDSPKGEVKNKRSTSNQPYLHVADSLLEKLNDPRVTVIAAREGAESSDFSLQREVPETPEPSDFDEVR